MKNRKVDGQITVISALCLTLVLCLVMAVFHSVKISTLNLHIEQSCRLGTEAVFSGYSNEILDEFDILLLRKSDMIDEKLNHYIEENLAYEDDVNFMGAKFDQLEMVTDYGGDNIRKEILAYMKYGVLSEAAQELLHTEENVKKTEKVREITDDILSCEETIYEMDAEVLSLIRCIEGIQTNENGLVIGNDKPLPVEDLFVKAAINGEVTMTSAAVDNQLVFDAVNHVTTYYTDINELLDCMESDVEDLADVGDEKSDALGSTASYAATYKISYDRLEKIIRGAAAKADESYNILTKYGTDSLKAQTDINTLRQQVEKDKDIIGSELGEEILLDLNEMSGAVSSPKKKMCDLKSIEKGIFEAKTKLNQVNDQLPQLNVALKQADCEKVKKALLSCRTALVGLSNEKLKFDYSGVDFKSNSSGMSAIKKLYDTLTDGLLSLVLENKHVSDKKLQIRDLSSALSGQYSGSDHFVIESAETILYDTYLLDRFQTYSDLLDENGQYLTEREGTDLLEYSIEYILCGEESDRDNLKETMMKLSLIREGTNLAYLLTDHEKKAEALALATSLLGFTGNMAIIKGGQYLILTVWAYGESIVDLKELYAGRKVELIKSKESWNLTLANLLTLTLDWKEKKEEKGLDYRGYLRMLLFMEETVQKNFFTMGAMELRIIGKGKQDFRMKDYVFAASGQAAFERRGINGVYTREVQYSYG